MDIGRADCIVSARSPRRGTVEGCVSVHGSGYNGYNFDCGYSGYSFDCGYIVVIILTVVIMVIILTVVIVAIILTMVIVVMVIVVIDGCGRYDPCGAGGGESEGDCHDGWMD